MPSSPTIGPATLTLHDYPDDDTLFPAKVLSNGDRAKILQWDGEERRYRHFDSIRDAVFTERADHLELTGISTTLVNVVGLKPEESRVRVEIRAKACAECG